MYSSQIIAYLWIVLQTKVWWKWMF